MGDIAQAIGDRSIFEAVTELALPETELEELWTRSGKDPLKAVASAREKIARWEYTSGWAHREQLEPFWRERSGEPDRTTRIKPPRAVTRDAYGFGEDGGLLLVERHDRDLVSQTVRWLSDLVVEQVTYWPRGGRRVERVELTEGGDVRRYFAYEPQGNKRLWAAVVTSRTSREVVVTRASWNVEGTALVPDPEYDELLTATLTASGTPNRIVGRHAVLEYVIYEQN